MSGRLLNAGEWKDLAVSARYDAKNLAKLCGISGRQLQREFRRQLGRSPQEWLDDQRIVAARQLLLSGEPLKKVAADLGYKQTSHFCRQFKSKNNMTPSEFVSSQFQFVLSCRPQITNVAQG